MRLLSWGPGKARGGEGAGGRGGRGDGRRRGRARCVSGTKGRERRERALSPPLRLPLGEAMASRCLALRRCCWLAAARRLLRPMAGAAAISMGCASLTRCDWPAPAAPPAAISARALLESSLDRHSLTREGEAVRFSVKAGRLCARLTLPPGTDLLGLLQSMLSVYPSVRWTVESTRGTLGDSLLLQAPKVAESTDGAPDEPPPLISLYISRSGHDSEVELLCTDVLRARDAEALALAISCSTRQASDLAHRRRPTSQLAPSTESQTEGIFDFFGTRAFDAPWRGGSSHGSSPGTVRPGERGATAIDPIDELEQLGVRVYQPGDVYAEGGWSGLAGSDAIRQLLEESIVLPLEHPEVYREIRAGTRAASDVDRSVEPAATSNLSAASRGSSGRQGPSLTKGIEARRPAHVTAILLEGPPGTGKTSAARVLATTLGRPLVHLPVESVVSKWYCNATHITVWMELALPRPLSHNLLDCRSLSDRCLRVAW